MAFRVEVAPQAFDDLDSIAGYIKKRSTFAVAERWFNSVIDEIDSLKNMPARCSIAPESEELGREVRLLLHGRRNRTYKIYSLGRLSNAIERHSPRFSRAALGPQAPQRRRTPGTHGAGEQLNRPTISAAPSTCRRRALAPE
jgi:plasmid stabilization system protein ParE